MRIDSAVLQSVYLKFEPLISGSSNVLKSVQQYFPSPKESSRPLKALVVLMVLTGVAYKVFEVVRPYFSTPAPKPDDRELPESPPPSSVSSNNSPAIATVDDEIQRYFEEFLINNRVDEKIQVELRSILTAICTGDRTILIPTPKHGILILKILRFANEDTSLKPNLREIIKSYIKLESETALGLFNEERKHQADLFSRDKTLVTQMNQLDRFSPRILFALALECLAKKPALLAEGAKVYQLGLLRMEKDFKMYGSDEKFIKFAKIRDNFNNSFKILLDSKRKMKRQWNDAQTIAKELAQELDRKFGYNYDPRWVIFADSMVSEVDPKRCQRKALVLQNLCFDAFANDPRFNFKEST